MLHFFLLAALAFIPSTGAGSGSPSYTIPPLKEGQLCGKMSVYFIGYGVEVGCEQGLVCRILGNSGRKPDIRCVRME
jgi:hypothetical protein